MVLHALVLTFHLALGLLVGLVATQARDEIAGRLMLTTAFMAFLVSPVQLENLINPFHIQIIHVCFFALLAFVAIERLSRTNSAQPPPSLVLLAVVAIVLCTYSMANGVIAAALCVALVSILRRRGPRSSSLPERPSCCSERISGTFTLWNTTRRSRRHSTRFAMSAVLPSSFQLFLARSAAAAPW